MANRMNRPAASGWFSQPSPPAQAAETDAPSSDAGRAAVPGANAARRLWLAIFPLLYAPDLGAGRATPFGTLALSDFLMAPFCLALWRAMSAEPAAGRERMRELFPGMIAFVVVAAAVTLLIFARYDYLTPQPVFFGLFKLAKLSLYAGASVLIALALRDDEDRRLYFWALLAALGLVGVTLLKTRGSVDVVIGSHEALEGYIMLNGVSVMLGILICYVSALFAAGYGDVRWRACALAAMGVGLLGIAVTTGRGGLVAMVAGLCFLVVRRGLRPAVLFSGLGAALCLVAAYAVFPVFQQQVDRTLHPNEYASLAYGTGVAGVDDGGRLEIMLKNIPKVIDDPLGKGFFHRAGQTNLPWSGCHNFWLQMFLETGALGGALFLLLFLRLVLFASDAPPEQAPLVLAHQTALLTAFVGGLSGEYYYGGMMLFTFLAVAAPIGSLPRGDAPRARPRPMTDAASSVFSLGAPLSPKPGLRFSDDRSRRASRTAPLAASDRS